VKLEVAEKLDPVGNIQSIAASPDKRFDEAYQKQSLDAQVEASRKALQSMIDNSNGEAQVIFRKKLEEFEAVVANF
jgi:hypothetical protein